MSSARFWRTTGEAGSQNPIDEGRRFRVVKDRRTGARLTLADWRGEFSKYFWPPLGVNKEMKIGRELREIPSLSAILRWHLDRLRDCLNCHQCKFFNSS